MRDLIAMVKGARRPARSGAASTAPCTLGCTVSLQDLPIKRYYRDARIYRGFHGALQIHQARHHRPLRHAWAYASRDQIGGWSLCARDPRRADEAARS